MMVGQDRHAKANSDALGSLAQRPEHDLWTWRRRKPGEEVVFHEPEIIEAHPVGQLALLQGLFIERVPIDIFALKRSLHLVQDAKLHGWSPHPGHHPTAGRVPRSWWEIERVHHWSVDVTQVCAVSSRATITQLAAVRQGGRAQGVPWPAVLQDMRVSHHRLDLLQDCAPDSSSYTTLSCTSLKPSTDSPTVSPGLTNLVATMLPVMTIIPWVKLLPCWASKLTNHSKASIGWPMTSRP